jgi:2-succinyl-5-enolpyruvyl-6-hydroxy-3-cyclohexene-1-carboxylate synthase
LSALADGGVRHVVVSSGSRCAPLAIAAGELKGIAIWTNPDERSAAFFALGVAKGSGQPAALFCTSGTAAANYFPAVIEARMSGVPLVVITADRPPHLRDSGAPQTIDQFKLYGRYAVHFEELPLPHSDPDTVRRWSVAGQQAQAKAKSAGGPVHLNTPFEEPLLPHPDRVVECVRDSIATSDKALRDTVPSEDQDLDFGAAETIAELLSNSERPVIVCGPQDRAPDLVPLIAELAQRIGAPILADVASQARRLPGAICRYDLILRDARVAARLAPDLILRIGGLPVSKSLNEWIASSPATAKIGIAFGRAADPYRCLSHVLHADPRTALVALLKNAAARPAAEGAAYPELWRKVDNAARFATMAETKADQNIESQVVMDVCDHAGRETSLFLSNSMPIRWADMYVCARDNFPRVLVNRGANGIDGIISTAAGIAVSTGETTICVLGDLAFLHDQNGLWRLAEEQVPLKLIVLNNGGGGVFHFLPVASHTAHFEPLVAMPHTIDLSRLAAAHGLDFLRVDAEVDIASILKECFTQRGPEIVEFRTDRRQNAQHHHDVIRRVSETARNVLGIG